MAAVIKFFDDWDKANSKKIHDMKSGMIMEYSLWVPVNAFQPHIFPILLFAFASLFPTCERELQKIDIQELEEKDRIQYQLTFVVVHYLCHALTVLCVTTFLKRFFNRPRPPNPKEI